MPKAYDQSYFDRWYRDPQYAVASPAELRRKVAMVVGQAEYYLGRRLRNVFDIGCGEAPWRAPLRRLRPDVHYRGLDSSSYAVSRYGRQRNIVLAAFGELAHLRLEQRFDLILCVDVLHYLPAAEIRAGLEGVVEMLEGIAFMEVYTREDQIEGDRQGFYARHASWYLKAFQTAGLLPCGSHCYLGPRLERRYAALERARLVPG